MSAHWHPNHWLQGVTLNAQDALHWSCLVALQDKLRMLGMTGIDSANIRIRDTVFSFREQKQNQTGDPTPLCIIAPGDKELKLPGLNATDDVGYPCLIAWYDKNVIDVDDNTKLKQQLRWREQAERALDNGRLTGLERVKTTPEMIVNIPTWINNYLVGLLGVLCIGRRARG